MSEEAYVVCCEPRVVLFGYASKAEIKKAHPTLKRVRCLVYWDTATRGVHGAAANGPSPGCRVTPAVESQTVDTKIEARLVVSAAAVNKWESAPWRE